MKFDVLTPRVPRIYLLLIAAFVWTFAGLILLFRGCTFMLEFPHFLFLKIAACTSAGIIFYLLLFSRISLTHILRIKNLTPDSPCLFSFFNLKSYFMMFIMITTGITLRTTGIVSPEYLSFVYITMGIPLLLSSFRFYFSFYNS